MSNSNIGPKEIPDCFKDQLPPPSTLGEETPMTKPTFLQELREKYEEKMQCNCDLDKWEPEMDTGHSFVCRIHKAVKEELRRGPNPQTKEVDVWKMKN